MDSATGEVSVIGGAKFFPGSEPKLLQTVSIAYNSGELVNGNTSTWSADFQSPETTLGDGSTLTNSKDTNTIKVDNTTAIVNLEKYVCATVAAAAGQTGLPTLHADSAEHEVVVTDTEGVAHTYKVGDATYPLAIENL